MRDLTSTELLCVYGGETGGTISVEYGAAITLGLMAISVTPAVLVVGGAALVCYALM